MMTNIRGEILAAPSKMMHGTLMVEASCGRSCM
jgi:hypothetical protein